MATRIYFGIPQDEETPWVEDLNSLEFSPSEEKQFTEPGELLKEINVQDPECIIIDEKFLSGNRNILQQIRDRCRQSAVPLLVLGVNLTDEERYDFMKQGATLVENQPIEPSLIPEFINNHVEASTLTPNSETDQKPAEDGPLTDIPSDSIIQIPDSLKQFFHENDDLYIVYIGMSHTESIYGQKGTNPIRAVEEKIDATTTSLFNNLDINEKQFHRTQIHDNEQILFISKETQTELTTITSRIDQNINREIEKLDVEIPSITVDGIDHSKHSTLPATIDAYTGIKSILGQVYTAPDHEEQQLKELIREALQSGAIHAKFQPIHDLRKDTVVGYEALSRCSLQELNNPFVLFQSAITAGLIDELEYVCRKNAITAFPLNGGHKNLFLNFYPETFSDPRIFDPRKNDPLNEMPPEHFVLEITERSAIDNLEKFKHQINLLQEQGYRIAIDDVGTGYASLKLIGQLNPDFIKLDMSLIRDIHKSPQKQDLLTTLVNLAESIEAKTVAEGVETEEELEYIKSNKCDFAQGFLLGRPQNL